MAAIEPGADNDYQVGPATAFSRALWNAVMQSVAARLRAREDLEASFEALVRAGTQAALDMIQVNVSPQLLDITEQVGNLNSRIGDLISGGTAPNALQLNGRNPSWYLALANATGTLPAAQVAGLAALMSGAVDAATADLRGGAPAGMDTLGKLAAAIGNDPNFSAGMVAALSGLRGGAPAGMDTLGKLAAAIGLDPNFSVAVGAALSARLRVDADQALTAAQQVQAAKNISAIRSSAAGTALPPADIGPIWHADFAAIMTWRTIGTFSGYASVNLGEVAAFAAAVPPPGWLRCNGAILSAADAALIAFLGKNTLPDLRAEFIRGLDDGRGVDAGRVLGSAQGSQNLAHAHTVPVSVSTSIMGERSSPGGRPFADSSASTTSESGGSEARPRNVALLYCIKR